MLLDRREKHIISELTKSPVLNDSEKRLLRKLVGRINNKECAVVYSVAHEVDPHVVSCVIVSLKFDPPAHGMAVRCPKDKYSYTIGRMIAFARACVNAVADADPPSDQVLRSDELAKVDYECIVYGARLNQG